MRIALLAPLVAPIAPPYLGGAQALLADLAAGLAARGHSVTLYAADGSQVPGVELPVLGIDAAQLTPARFGDDKEAAGGAMQLDDSEDNLDDDGLLSLDHEAYLSDYAFLRAYRAIAEQASKLDVLHAHAYDVPAFAYTTTQPLPVVHTLHLPAVDAAIRATLATIAPPQAAITPPARLVTVSQACAATYAPFCHIDAVIYNGIAVERIPFGPQAASEEYLLYAGRITPEKGVEDALEIASRAGKHLILAGGIYDQDYYKQRIAPQLAARSETVQYLGALAREDIWQLMAGATAVLCPVHWDEPFGLVACEAQAAGAPIVGYARGGLCEVVADGVTGMLVAPGDIAAAVEAVHQATMLERADCRAWVAEHFSLDTMLDAYEAFYQQMLDQ